MPPCPLHRPGLVHGGNSGVGVRGRTSCSVWPGVSVKMSWLALLGVRIKTFSTHVVIVFRLAVRRKRFSTHEESRVVFSPFVKISQFDIGDIDLYPIFVKNKIMPELWRIYGMRFFFYSREHEPMHVHVKSADGIAKFNVSEKGAELVSNSGMKLKDINLALDEIIRRKEIVITEWEIRFGK